MGFFDSIILGIVEGITEFLPISSTGHLILFSELFRIPQSDFVKSFEIAIQLGAILSVVVLYWRELILNKKIFWRVVAAFVPTAILGLIFYKIVKTYLLGNALVVLLSLLLGGIGIILFEKWFQKKPQQDHLRTLQEISVKDSIFIGLFQSIAMIPGISRSAATILGGLFLGIERKAIVEFSFLLAVPTMAAATGLDLLQSAAVFNAQEIILLLTGFFVSFVVAIFAIKFLLAFVEKNSFISFGWYRIIVAILFAAIIFF